MSWVGEMRTLGERLDRMQDNMEGMDTKPDVSLLAALDRGERSKQERKDEGSMLKQEEASRRKQEEGSRRKLEEGGRKKQEDVIKRKQEDGSKRKQEEGSKRKQEEVIRRIQDEGTKKKEEEAGRRKQEDEVSSGDAEDTQALTSGKLKLKIKTEGGKRFSKVISEDKENINLKEKESLINGEPAVSSERVRLDSIVVTPLSTSERAIDALLRQQNKTVSTCTSNSEVDSLKDVKEDIEQRNEVACDLFSEPEQEPDPEPDHPPEPAAQDVEKLVQIKSEISIDTHPILTKENLNGPHIDGPNIENVELLQKQHIRSSTIQPTVKPEPAQKKSPELEREVRSRKAQRTNRPGPASTKTKKMLKKSIQLGSIAKRKSLMPPDYKSDSGTSELTNGHIEKYHDLCGVKKDLIDPDEFSDPDRGNWLKDNAKYPRWIRFKCPYCTFTESKRHVVDDHIIIDHSIQGTSKMVPKYGEATKQMMFLMIERDPQLFTKYHEDMLFCDDDNMSILEEVCQDALIFKGEVLNTSTASDTSLTSDQETCNLASSVGEWLQCDATLPAGWQYKEVMLQNGTQRKSYLSSCGKMLSSRDTVAEFLLGRGLDIMHPTGFSGTYCMTGLPTQCSGKEVVLLC